MYISVIICTHNPRVDYLKRALEGLQHQTLSKNLWELLLIDNASNKILASEWDLNWHPKSRHIREEELGLTPARLRGISEAQFELLVFVDDDNILTSNYLEIALEIANKYPLIGAYGGSTIGEFEKPYEKKHESCLNQLAIRRIEQPQWACLPGTKALYFAPCGAGMVIRNNIAKHYAKVCKADEISFSLDRKGSSLASAGDSDLAFTACSLGFAIGLFPELSLTHLIPSARLEDQYLIRLAEAMSYSHALLRYQWDKQLPIEHVDRSPLEVLKRHLRQKYQFLKMRIRLSKLSAFDYRIKMAKADGLRRAMCEIMPIQTSKNSSSLKTN